MKYIIEIKSLTKKFGSFTAVNSIDLKIREGEISGFLGPNGAGKTTTINMLTTLIKPTSGTALVAGHDILREGVEVRSVIGVVPQLFSLFPELSAQENLAYIGKLYGMSSALIKERSEYLLKTVALYDHRDRIAGIFSGGMKQRLSLAAGIMSNPKILFMDEPTTGLDPQSRIAIRELTKQLNRQGITIVYTTHDMDEAEKICDRIIIMDKG
jgi:ABC-2 type transport system ATP-binding protein